LYQRLIDLLRQVCGHADEKGETALRIAMVAPVFEAVPPLRYGGTERVVSVLSEELVRRGHDVTLFASGDSVTGARLVVSAPQALRIGGRTQDFIPSTLLQLSDVYAHASEYDVIHNHVDHLAFGFARLSRAVTVSTAHGRLDLPTCSFPYAHFPDHPLVSISDSQRAPLPEARWVKTVHNGIDLSHFRFRSKPGDYLVFLGRISPEKRPDRAIELARDLGMRLVMAAKVDDVDRAYYEHAIKPLIESSSLIDFVGEVDEVAKDEILGNAYAYLFPIDWPEPFGLTMTEAMATGTPVVAYRAGSVPEVIVDGVTGFICRSFREMLEAIPRVADLDRAACRRRVEAHFSASTMADGYEAVYRQLTSAPREVPLVLRPRPRIASAPARRYAAAGTYRRAVSRVEAPPIHAGRVKVRLDASREIPLGTRAPRS
jgi:glycosyltransferase involved in cell wall biosynthesis